MLGPAVAMLLTVLPHREVYWNVAHPHVKVFLPLAIFAVVFGYGVWRRIKIWRQGRPAGRTGDLAGRIWRAVKDSFSQRLVMREWRPGTTHALLFFGFVVLFIGTLIVMVEADFGFPVLSTPSHFYWVFTVTLNLFGLAALVGVIFLALRRYVFKSRYLENGFDDWFSIALIIAILVTGHLVQALRLATEQPWWSAYSFVSYPLAKLFWDADPATLRTAHEAVWWIHYIFALSWIALIPFTKIWHIFAGPLGLVFRSPHHRGRIEKMDLEDEEAESFGVGRLEDLTWKNLLDGDACIVCGRCQENCPAKLTGKELNPKRVILDIRDHMEEVYKLSRKKQKEGGEEGGAEDGSGRRNIHGDVIPANVLWACTSCFACETHCPMGIEHLDIIFGMRQSLTLMDSAFPKEMTTAFKGWETSGNPWQLGAGQRFDWAEGMGLKTLGDDPEHEILFYVGCAGSYDSRAIKVTQAFVKILRAAGVKFGLLGTEEGCCGETARRAGNEYLGQMLIQANVETLNNYNVKRIVTACPHGYNTLKNEYPDFGGYYEVIHHTQYIAELIASGRLKLKGNGIGPVVFHDSCYLGRWNKIYDEPRMSLAAVPGLELREAPRNRRKGFCCGAGGARMWMEETEGTRVNHERTTELAGTGATTFATACPYCLTMLADGINDKGMEESHQALDIAQVVADHLED
ncbi:MAG: 4Fe-4S dicluster domain-containing protein [Candidatus Eisenbacteria bacterium]|nr:4Fe-4S dicluster domain-containing protein [Candidatus Eisenbacteria bacterium]